ncbi:MAG: GAF domain-containing sensor histidine kinase [Dehalococcoidales bacterium]|nr:GAF domain-containing sensor histidine kinase [Dehalococcoidales bacterium]
MSVNQIMENAQIYKESIRNEVLLNLGVANHKLAIESGIDKFIETVVQIAFSSTSSDYVSIKVNGNATGETLVKSETGTFHEPWRTIIESLDDFSDAIIISENTECNPRFLSLMNEAGISSIIRVPLVTRGNVVGAITTMKATGKRPFIESDLSFISILAWWTSMAIDNTRVYLDYFKEYLHADRLLDQISFVQEKERNRVAVEIHDGVAQWLVGASYDIKLCSKLISESNLTELEITIEKIRDVLQRSVKELRRAISNLPLPPLEELGLAGVIMKLAQKLEEDGIRCNITFPDKFPELTIPQQKTFYWLLQESFTNIQKHSQASRVDIEFTNRDDMVSIHVVDDGVGFSVDKAMSSKLSLEHIGLLGMRERADLLNGNLDIESEPGKGTSIDLSFSLLPSDVFSIART